MGRSVADLFLIMLTTRKAKLMSQTLLDAEPTIRLVAFLGILAAMALW